MAQITHGLRNVFFPKTQNSTYDKLPITDAQDDGEQLPSEIPWKNNNPPHHRAIVRLSVIVTTLLTVSLAATALILVSKPTPKNLEEEISCGHTPAEARDAGCIFEPMMSAWVPAQCSFPELIDDNAGTFENWLFFSDETIRKPITGLELEGVRVGNYTKVFSSHGTAHDLHCLYAWRKLNLAVETGAKLIDTKSRSLHHTTHCAKHIAQLVEEGAGFLPKKQKDGMVTVTALPLLYLKCVPLV
ncbi:hypothetical protein F5Y08DRAFT_310299 [Xylaria arbuscula]|uniref:Uncharacterized protein n=1 Tax=Xylaria arbuscula TaxID=114810 RepID=A0A9W8NJT9_9PEZI|nr:hypothetical protein F5Y08DRAFT_310299 [Xylaria arbuscula]KAJ3577663.1 hypothetical protein NPX13_g2906 [Xylaria arbuscula]